MAMRELETNCACPDWANPCKHIAVLYYLLASTLDRDPFLMFELRGLTREALHTELIKTKLGKILASALKSEDLSDVEPVESDYTPPAREPGAVVTSHKEFWTGTKRLPPLPATSPTSVSALLIKKQGDYPQFWHKDVSFISTMEELYDRVRTKSKQMK
jgi:uncharacterized Zn finger protein